jgi:CDP-paratose 2-epimerase
VSSALSLAQLTSWCDTRFGPHAPEADLRPRTYDLPWVIMDSADAIRDFHWRREMSVSELLEEIARHAERHPDWLERSGV